MKTKGTSTPRAKKAKCHFFNYNDRKAELTMQRRFPTLFTLTCGVFLNIDKDTYSMSWVSNKQKQLSQFFYNYLVENNLPTNAYILNVEAPMKSIRPTTFFELNLTTNSLITDDVASNEALCRTILDKMTQLFTQETNQL